MRGNRSSRRGNCPYASKTINGSLALIFEGGRFFRILLFGARDLNIKAEIDPEKTLHFRDITLYFIKFGTQYSCSS
ncbi:uncharacterized protein J3R85_012015 [Psidium guajava]|nr:uncharacterized protein J3R85_012015 [Psidium guajava]